MISTHNDNKKASKCHTCEYAYKAWMLFQKVNNLADFLVELFEADFFKMPDELKRHENLAQEDLPF